MIININKRQQNKQLLPARGAAPDVKPVSVLRLWISEGST